MAEFIVIARANLNIRPGFASPEHIHVVQYDGDWQKQLQLTLYDGTELYPIPVAVDKIVISGTKADGTGFSYFCTWENATVTAPLMRQMTICNGKVPVNITLFDSGDNQLSSAMFVLDVQEAALQSSTLESSNDFQTFLEYSEEAQYYAQMSKSYAVGDTAMRPGENIDNAQYYWNLIKNVWGSPLTATSSSGMTDHSRVYVFVGTQGGYTTGNWYYWNGSAWTSGGVYNAQGIDTDKDLEVLNKPADGKAVGDALASIRGDITELTAESAKSYKSDDAVETAIDAADYIPFYDSSASAQKRIRMSNFTTGGSTITVRTSESNLFGKTVTISDGGTTLTRTFSNVGVAVFSGVTLTGTLTVTSVGTTQTARATININYYSSYTVVLAFWSATVNITADDAFYEATVVVKNSSSATVGTVTLSDSGTGSFTALYPDTYTLSAEYSGDTYIESVVVSEQTTYTVEFNSFIVYGFHIDGSESDPNSNVTYHVQYDGENVKNYNYSPAYYDFSSDSMNPGSWNLVNDFFIPRSCMLKFDGTVDYYLSESDETLREDGTTASDVANTSYGGNAMMEWGRNGKKIWIKIVPDNGDVNSATIYVSNEQLDSGFNAYPFTDANGNITEHCYTAKYSGSNISNKLRSISGQTPANGLGGTSAKTYALANNTGNATEWYTDVYCDRVMINILLMMISKSTNSQAKFGEGHSTGGTGAASLLASGTMNGKGLFWGKDTTGYGVKVFGMEHYWGNQYTRVAGLLYGGGVQYCSMTGNYTNGGTNSSYFSVPSSNISPSAGSLSKCIYTANGIFPKTPSGSTTTYYCDGTYAGTVSTTWYYALMGGHCGTTAQAGMFMYNFTADITQSGWQMGDKISCKPLA